MPAYYNEWEPYAAQWLRNLIAKGYLPDGDVDERSITEVEADEIKGYDQHHFFAGIGGWALAARLAGVSDSERIVTGSPPCQPFSAAGQGKGYADERHLAPHWLRLVAAIRPDWVFGEQVAAAIRKDDWLDDLLDALEAEGYATGASVLPACSVGAPHIRQRLWVVARLADANALRRKGERGSGTAQSERVTECQQAGGLADTSFSTISRRGIQRPGKSDCQVYEPGQEQRSKRSGTSVWMADTSNGNRRAGLKQDETERSQGYDESARLVSNGWMAQSNSTGSQPGGSAAEATRHRDSADAAYCADRHESASTSQAGWRNPDWLWCRDGKWRPVESGTFPLADGVSGRVGRLRAYGNAIVPQVAAKIITEAMQNAT